MNTDEKKALRKRLARAARFLTGLTLTLALTGFTLVSVGIPAGETVFSNWQENQPGYKAEYGKWDEVQIPDKNRINAIHQALLPTGKVLLVAGSGNNRDNFEAGSFKTLVYDPATGDSHLVPTPVDLFCSGHAFLPNGNLLVAGGTQNYEVLKGASKYAGTPLSVSNATHRDVLLPKGTEFQGAESKVRYKTDAAVLVPAAYKNKSGKYQASNRNVYIAATVKGKPGTYGKQSYNLVAPERFVGTVTATADSVTMDKKEYEGISASYEFNPHTERYVPVSPLNYARWYPTLTAMPDGHVMAISGLDGAGKILGGQTEIYDPATHKWIERKDLQRYFPTYPAVFSTGTPGVMFSAGPSTGYGPANKGRTPGFWYLKDNTFKTVKGLRDPGLLETGNATWLGPVNDQRIAVIGGGGVGDTDTGTGRIDVISLNAKNPRFTPLTSLPQKTRYPNTVPLPTGNLFITNGSTGYRGSHDSNILQSFMLDYKTGRLTRMADPHVGRDYHSTALLLPNGQILTAGSDPLYGDKDDTTPGKFEQRIEIYTPPYLFNKDGSMRTRPRLASNGYPGSIAYGQTVSLSVEDDPSSIAHVRLLHPGAVTHVTDTNQRIVDLSMTRKGNKLEVALPKNPALTPPGYYMMFLVDEHGTPSNAYWVQVLQKGDKQMDMRMTADPAAAKSDAHASMHH